jgi:hypothetical protein
MNREDIIKMAREAGFSVTWPETVPNFERFAALVAAAEREACAQMADEEAQLFGITDDVVAHRIRARGQE